MSMTPLHILAGVPFRKRLHFWAFAWANILMDLPVITYILNDTLGDVSPHDTLHGLHVPEYALMVVFVVWFIPHTWRAFYSALLGVGTHLLIDAIYHSDVMPSWGLYGLLSAGTVDALLLAIFAIPVGWESFQRRGAKLTN